MRVKLHNKLINLVKPKTKNNLATISFSSFNREFLTTSHDKTLSTAGVSSPTTYMPLVNKYTIQKKISTIIIS